MIRVIPKVDLGVRVMVLLFCGKHPLLMAIIRVGDPGPKGPIVVVFYFFF